MPSNSPIAECSPADAQDELTTLRARLAEFEGRLKQTREDARAREVLTRDVRRLRERCEQADIEIARLQKQLANVQNTLSFRLGFALIESSQSFRAFKALPRTLSQLRREAVDRRKHRKTK